MGLLTAIATLTIIPVPQSKRPSFGKALLYFPLVGVGIGVLQLGLVKVTYLFAPSLNLDLLASLLVVFSSFITGGLHLDGLGDFLDSLAGRDPKKRLEIMKDKHMGAYGVIGIALALLLKYAAIKGLIQANQDAIVLPFLMSRTCLSYLSSNLSYARLEGTGKPFVEESRPFYGWIAFFYATIVSLLFGLKGPLILGLGLILSIFLKRYFKHKYGGITGDLLGASNELAELSGLVVLNLLV